MAKKHPTLEELRQSMSPSVYELNKHLFEQPEPAKKQKKSKYNNTRCEWEGIKFASVKECNRYKHLLILLKAGQIGQLRLQVSYQLNEDGKFSYEYIADFVYIDKFAGEIVEDAKGHRTEEYKKKKRLMKEVHKIEIHEV